MARGSKMDDFLKKFGDFLKKFVWKSCQNEEKCKRSAKISKKNREILDVYIKKNCIWAIGSASLKEIEKYNIIKPYAEGKKGERGIIKRTARHEFECKKAVKAF